MKFLKTIYFVIIFFALNNAIFAAEINQKAISTIDPRTVVPTAGLDPSKSDTLANGLSPTLPYEEYGTVGKPIATPIPYSNQPCQGGTGQQCHYPTNRWFTDLTFYAKHVVNGEEVGDKYSTALSPYNITVSDGANINNSPQGSFFTLWPGLYFSYNMPNVNVDASVKPYPYNLYGDMYYPYLISNDSPHWGFVSPFDRTPLFYQKTERKILYYDPLSLVTQWHYKDNPNANMTAFLVRGTPYLTLKYNNFPLTLVNSNMRSIQAGTKDANGNITWEKPIAFVDNQPLKNIHGNVFKIIMFMNDFSKAGQQASATYPLRYFEYLLVTSEPINLAFTPNYPPPYAERTLVSSDNEGNRTPFNGTVRLAFVGTNTNGTTDISNISQLGFDEVFNKQINKEVENTLLQYADDYAFGVNLQLSANGKSGEVVFNWKKANIHDQDLPNWNNPPSNDTPLLMTAFKTQIRDTQFDFTPQALSISPNYKFSTIKGDMLPVLGSQWKIKVPFSAELQQNKANLLWYGKAVPEAFQAELQKTLSADIALLQKPQSYSRPSIRIATKNDSYAFGKEVARIARLALIAEQLKDATAKNVALTHVTTAMNPWLITPGEGNNADKNVALQSFIKYDPLFGGAITARASLSPDDRISCQYNGEYNKDLCGYTSDFYNGQYTDHHFHYGYFLYSAAVLAKLNPAWLSTNGGQYKNAIDILARDLANPNSEADPYFTQYRYFDWFEGHGFANGLGPGTSGRNQESTSEAINAWYSLVLWGEATGNKDLANIARIMTMLEAKAAQDWTQINATPGASIYDDFWANFNNRGQAIPRINFRDLVVSGINWALKIDHTTFFGLIESYLIGIQLMPYTPISDTLISSSWLKSKAQSTADAISPGNNILTAATDKLINKINLFQETQANTNNIFSKFAAEWEQCSTSSPPCKPSLNEFLMLFEGILNGAYQWGLQSVEALAKVNPELAYQYVAYNTSGSFFNSMQKVNDAFAKEALNKNGTVTIKGLSPAESICAPNRDNQPIAYCFHDKNISGPIGWPVAKLNYDQIDHGDTITNLLWYIFAHLPNDAKLPASLFWLDDNLIVSKLNGFGAYLSWAPATTVNSNTRLPMQYTIKVGDKVYQTEETALQLTELKPDTDYMVSVTASLKGKKNDASMIKNPDGNPAYITRYIPFRTLPSNFTGNIQFDGHFSNSVSNDKITISWEVAKFCPADQPNNCVADSKFMYEVKSQDQKTSYCNTSDLSCSIDIANLGTPDSNGFYTVNILAKIENAPIVALPYVFSLQR